MSFLPRNYHPLLLVHFRMAYFDPPTRITSPFPCLSSLPLISILMFFQNFQKRHLKKNISENENQQKRKKKSKKGKVLGRTGTKVKDTKLHLNTILFSLYLFLVLLYRRYLVHMRTSFYFMSFPECTVGAHIMCMKMYNLILNFF